MLVHLVFNFLSQKNDKNTVENNKSPCLKTPAPSREGANFQDMITLSAITIEGVTFLEDMFASRAESLSGGVKLFASRRLFKWDI